MISRSLILPRKCSIRPLTFVVTLVILIPPLRPSWTNSFLLREGNIAKKKKCSKTKTKKKKKTKEKETEEEEEEEEFSSSLEVSCRSECRLTVEFDPRLSVLIESELGLNDPQTSRKNAWGNLSYAELIAKAIENSQDKRLTLSQIYSWMIQYVPYFRDKGDRKSSTGWKVSSLFSLLSSLYTSFSFD